jgi:hypothetical protein
MLVKETVALPCEFLARGFLAYRHQIVGIHAEPSEREELKRFFESFRANREALSAFCVLLGVRPLVGKATAILKHDIDALPWPEDGNWDLSPWERVLCDDVVKFICDYVRLGQNSALLKKQATQDDVGAYTKQFCSMLGSVYGNLRALPPLYRDGLVHQAFCFGPRPEVDWPEGWTADLRKTVYVKHGESLRTARVLRFYTGNVIIIVKPDRLRYWIRSTAIRDADETLVDLRKQGY